MTENRASFFARLAPYFSPSVMLDVELAYTLAKYGHRAQVRQELDSEGKPVRYFEHVRRVALILIDEVQFIASDMIITCLVHDGFEDTRDLTPEMVEHCFGSNVVSMVKTLSKVPKDGYLERFFICDNWQTYVVKACDRLDNLRSLSQATPEFRQKQLRETKEKYLPLFDRMVELTPAPHKEKVVKLHRLILNELISQMSL